MEVSEVLFNRNLIRKVDCFMLLGGTVGLMGDLSKTVDSEGGSVIGVIPRALCKREISGDG